MVDQVRPTTNLRLAPFRALVTHDPQTIDGKLTSALFEYWSERKSDAPVPAWTSFQFMDLHKIAPYMTVLDVPPSNDPNKVVYRFMGTKIVEYRRQREIPDLTGRAFDEADRLYDPQPMVDAIAAAIADGLPVLMIGEYETADTIGTHARLILPWTIDGTVQRLTTVLERMPQERF